MENNDDNGNKKKKGAMKDRKGNVSGSFGVRAPSGRIARTPCDCAQERPLGASSNKKSTRGAMTARKADVSKAFSSSSNQKSKRAAMNAQVKNVSKALKAKINNNIVGFRRLMVQATHESRLGASSNKQSTKGAMEVDTLAGFVIIVIFIVVIMTIILKNKEFIQRLLP